MFSLIISIIAIALVAALAGASVYYGGSAFNKGTAEADAAAFQNAGSQVAGAVAIATNDEVWDSGSSDLSTLTSNYLTQIPSYKDTQVSYSSGNSYMTAEVSESVCKELENLGENDTLSDDGSYAEGNSNVSGLSGCNHDDTGGTNTAFYKVD